MLKGPHIDVGRCDFGDQQHQSVVVVLDGTVEPRVRRLDRTAEPAPEIQFPRQAAAHAPRIELPQGEVAERDRAASGKQGRLRTALGMRVFAEDILGLGEQAARRDGPLRLDFGDPETGLPQRNILPVCKQDQPIEHWVVKDTPPRQTIDRGLGQTRIAGIDPIVGHRCGWAAIVGPDFVSVVNVFGHAGAAAACDEQTDQ